MEVLLLSNVRDIGLSKIGRYYLYEGSTFLDSVRELSFALSSYKVPAFSFLKYWDFLRDSDDSRLSSIKTWSLQLDALMSTTPSSEVDRSSKRKFSHAYTSLWKRFKNATGVSDIEINPLMELGLKLPFAVLLLGGSVSDELVRLTGATDVEHLEDLIDFIMGFYSAVFNWDILTSSEPDLAHDGVTLLDLLRLVALLGSSEFTEHLQKRTLLEVKL